MSRRGRGGDSITRTGTGGGVRLRSATARTVVGCGSCDWSWAGVRVGGLCSDSRLELMLPLNAALHLHDACVAKPFL
jgi:hypothetical protein